MSSLRFHRRHLPHLMACLLTVVVSAGGAATVFTVMNALWFRPPSIPAPGRIAVVLNRTRGQDPSRFSPAAISGFRELGVFDGVAGQVMTRDFMSDLMPHVRLAKAERDLEALGVTEDYFDVLGLRVIGPGLSAGDTSPGAPLSGILSYRVWQEVYQADPSIIGATIETSPMPLRVMGVAPAGFNGALRGERVDLWLPYTHLHRLATGANAGGSRALMPMVNFCRLRAGATLATSRAAFVSAYTATGRRADDLDLVPLQSLFGAPDLPMVVIRQDQIVYVIGGVAGLLLLVGCATLTALLLVHYEQRRQEMAVRIALGARSADLIRQTLLELAAAAAVAMIGVFAVVSAAAKVLPRFVLRDGVDFSRLDFNPDWRVVVVAGVACVAVMVASAALPLIRLLRTNVITNLAAVRSTGGRRTFRIHRTILGAHAALTVVCVIFAALFVRSAINAVSRGPGFDPDRTLFVSVRSRSIGPNDEKSALNRMASASRDLIDEIGARPGVEAVALGGAPLGDRLVTRLGATSVVEADGIGYDMHVTVHAVGPGYLEALGVPLVAGRPPRQDEVVVSTTLAAEAWPDASPLDRLLRWGPVLGRVAGVVDMGFGSIRLGRPRVFLTFDLVPPAQPTQPLNLVVRTEQPDRVRDEIRQLSARAFPDATLISITSGRELVEKDLGQERLGASFLSAIGGAAWVLGIASVFGLVGYVVERQRREFGIMSALGASRTHLIWLAAREGLEPALIGGLAGVVAAIVLSRTVESFLLGVAGIDAATYAGAVALFAVVAAIASVVAASRMRYVRPSEALRGE